MSDNVCVNGLLVIVYAMLMLKRCGTDELYIYDVLISLYLKMELPTDSPKRLSIDIWSAKEAIRKLSGYRINATLYGSYGVVELLTESMRHDGIAQLKYASLLDVNKLARCNRKIAPIDFVPFINDLLNVYLCEIDDDLNRRNKQ